MTLLQWGNEEQKQKYLVPQAKGEKIGAFGLTEPDAGSDVAAMKSTAQKKGILMYSMAQKRGFPYVTMPIIFSFLLKLITMPLIKGLLPLS